MSLANATIQEIAAAISTVIANSSTEDCELGTRKDEKSLPASRIKRKQLVRNFIIQAMPEESPSVPLGKQFEENWEIANALILHESSNVEVAAALCNELSIQGAQAKILSF